MEGGYDHLFMVSLTAGGKRGIGMQVISLLEFILLGCFSRFHGDQEGHAYKIMIRKSIIIALATIVNGRISMYPRLH
ncbi:MAG: hypothetical protein Ct9H90mV3_240 [uncultured marine virus]|nr:MAG: hypothetical protein Ct9H90mV3_240 [uncultured marine virus]